MANIISLSEDEALGLFNLARTAYCEYNRFLSWDEKDALRKIYQMSEADTKYNLNLYYSTIADLL